jgi:Trk K+ transport system NAD-binding subunit
VDKDPARGKPFGENFITGSAADLVTLERAGIAHAPAVLITTRDDDMNIYLTIYCRKLRPDIQIIARATGEENTARLHRAGADFVMSYATMGAGILFNLLRKRGDIVMVAEGLNVFRVPLPHVLHGTPLAESGIRSDTGCNVVAVERSGVARLNPEPTEPLLPGDELVLIGTVEAEEQFLKTYATRSDA